VKRGAPSRGLEPQYPMQYWALGLRRRVQPSEQVVHAGPAGTRLPMGGDEGLVTYAGVVCEGGSA
jgi:hypothetical protein